MSWRSRIGRITPGELKVTTHGQARLRVEGSVRGSLRVGKERRWVWGEFDETFVVRPTAGLPVKVVLSGLGGRERELVACSAPVDLQSPALVASFPPVTCQFRLPRARGLKARRVSVPRVVRLARAPIQFTSPAPSETQGNS